MKFTIPETDIVIETCLWWDRWRWKWHYWCYPDVDMNDESAAYSGGIRWACTINWLCLEFGLRVKWD